MNFLWFALVLVGIIFLIWFRKYAWAFFQVFVLGQFRGQRDD